MLLSFLNKNCIILVPSHLVSTNHPVGCLLVCLPGKIVKAWKYTVCAVGVWIGQ